MTEEGRREAAAEELRLAVEELRAADYLLAGGLTRVALTRAYFCAFHAVRALLYANNLEPRSHTGVQHLFSVHFVRPGRFSAGDARLLSRLQKYREDADYGVSSVAEESATRSDLDAVRDLLMRVRAALG